MEANPLKSVSTPLCGQARLHVLQGFSSPREGGIRGSLKIVNLCILLFVRSIALWHCGDRGSKCEQIRQIDRETQLLAFIITINKKAYNLRVSNYGTSTKVFIVCYPINISKTSLIITLINESTHTACCDMGFLCAVSLCTLSLLQGKYVQTNTYKHKTLALKSSTSTYLC